MFILSILEKAKNDKLQNSENLIVFGKTFKLLFNFFT